MSNYQVRFKYGTQDEYNNLTNYDDNVLYFTTDTHHIYKGTIAYNESGVVICSSLPATGNADMLYVNTSDNMLYRWNTSYFQNVLKTYATSINDTNNNDNTIPTTKATKTYVDNAIANIDVNIDTTTTIDTSASDDIIATAKATKTYVDNAISTKADISYVDNQLTNKADKVIVITETGAIPNPIILNTNTDYRYTNSNTSTPITVKITDSLSTSYISSLSCTLNLTDYTELSSFISMDSSCSNQLAFLNGDIDISESNHLNLLFFSDGSRICCIGATYNI